MNATCTSMEALLAGRPASHCFTAAANSNRIDRSRSSRACPRTSSWPKRGILGKEKVIPSCKRTSNLHPDHSHSHSHRFRGQRGEAVVTFALFGGGGKPKSQQGAGTCRKCKGKGGIECPGCKGTGKNKKNGNLFERWKCYDCQGFGLISCPQCGKAGLTPEQRGER